MAESQPVDFDHPYNAAVPATKPRWGWPSLLAALLAAAGCAPGLRTPAAPGPARKVSLEDFARPRPEPSGGPPAGALASADPSAGGPGAEPPGSGLDEASDAVPGGGPVAEPGAAPADPADAAAEHWRFLARARPGQPVTVDSLVGEVNGRPIFADEFLMVIEDRLLSEAAQSTGQVRDAGFRQIIAAELEQVVTNELLLSEVESSLSEQEQMGLFALLRSLKEETIRREGIGARAEAEKALRDQGAEGLEAYIEDQRQRYLLYEIWRRKIDPRVIISWRDIEREYEKRSGEFNPPASVTLARIRLDSEAQAELVARVRARLEAGEDFAKVAEDAGFADGGRWDTFELGPDGLAGIGLAEPIRSALADLREGQTAGPIVQGSATLWIHVVQFASPQGRDIYDPEVQRLLVAEVEGQRKLEEWRRYRDSLFAKGIYDDLEEMSDRLFAIARMRYAGEPR